jgi:hypothetical protein
MDFPSAGLLLRQYNVFLFSGPLLILGTLGYWGYRIFRRRGPESPPSPPPGKALLASGAALLIGVVHFLGIYASLANARNFRFDPKDVAELRVVRMGEEGRATSGDPKTIRDRAMLDDGLSRLVESESRHRNHEHYSDGYRIQIVIPGSPADRYLSVYRRSSGGGAVSVVIPHLGASHAGTVNHAGEYSCPEFLAWVAKSIDPLFQGR